jgi:cyclopropane fatty-acyl-phospholipid synthase-like methyltransferase
MKSGLWITRNMILNWIVLILQVVLFYKFGWVALLFYPLFFILTYIFSHVTSVNLFDTDEMVQRCYSYVDSFLKLQNSGIDLGFNFWDKTYVTNIEAQQRKWNYMINAINLKQGDWLLDVGCGYGDWLNYAKSKGINVLGINISPQQAEAVKKKFDIDVLNITIHEFYKIVSDTSHPKHDSYAHLLGKFDAITFMDTVEHYAPPQYKWFRKKQDAIYQGIFHLSELLSKEKGRVFISCLHTNDKPMDIYRKFCWYILDSTMCGLYPHGKDGLTKNASSYTVISHVDRTEDYRLSAVKTSEGWQRAKFRFGLRFLDFSKTALYFFAVDPFLFHHLLSQIFNAWMSFYGRDAYDRSYDPEKRQALSYVNLYMILLEKKQAIANSV